jgi:hypothetical protein
VLSTAYTKYRVGFCVLFTTILLNAPFEDRHHCGPSRSHAYPARRMGDAAQAGLLALRVKALPGLPNEAFVSGQWGFARRLQLRGQPRLKEVPFPFPRSLFTAPVARQRTCTADIDSLSNAFGQSGILLMALYSVLLCPECDSELSYRYSLTIRLRSKSSSMPSTI